MILCRMSVGYIDTNSYIVGDAHTKEVAVIDPGADGEKIVSEINKLGVSVKYIIITHGHYDHIGAVDYVKERCGGEIVMHPDERLKDGVTGENARYLADIEPDILAYDGMQLQLGQYTLDFIVTPGHSVGSLCVIMDTRIFVGDVLFRESCGRCDLYGGSFDKIVDSITRLYNMLPSDTLVYPGHGPMTTIGYEKQHNPYVKGI